MNELAQDEHRKMLRTWRRQAQSRAQIDKWHASLSREFDGAVKSLVSAGLEPDALIRRPDLLPQYLKVIEHVPARIEAALKAGHALSDQDLDALRTHTKLLTADAPPAAAAPAAAAPAAAAPAAAPAAAAPAAESLTAAAASSAAAAPPPPRYSIAKSTAARIVASRNPRSVGEQLLGRVERRNTFGDRLLDLEKAKEFGES